MSDGNVLQEKSYQFSLQIIKLYQQLVRVHREYVLARQVLRSGTSVGANVEEAIGAQTRNDFRAKMAIAYREARETGYWLRLLRDSGYLDADLASPLSESCTELQRILAKIQITMHRK